MYNKILTFVLSVLLCKTDLIFGKTWSPDTATWKLGTALQICVLMKGHVEFIIPYEQIDGEWAVAHVVVPRDASENGTCTEWTQEFTLTWPSPQNHNSVMTNSTEILLEPEENLVNFMFRQNGTNNSVLNGYYGLNHVQAAIHTDPINFPQAQNPDKIYTMELSGLNDWIAPVDLSYYCNAESIIPLDQNITLLTKSFQVQAFHEGPVGQDSFDFGPRSYCAQDVSKMMIFGLLLIGLLFFVAFAINIFFAKKRQITYQPI